MIEFFNRAAGCLDLLTILSVTCAKGDDGQPISVEHQQFKKNITI